jgi:hypothetical protein
MWQFFIFFLRYSATNVSHGMSMASKHSAESTSWAVLELACASAAFSPRLGEAVRGRAATCSDARSVSEASSGRLLELAELLGATIPLHD